MARRSSYQQGTPNWVDLQTTDLNGAKSFYGTLFGWQFDEQPMPEGGEVYSIALKNDGAVAAIATQSPELAKEGAPAMWNTYFAAEDVDAAAAKVEAAGGKLAMPPFDVLSAGRMAFALDPSRAGFAIWQARDHIGATVVNEPGAVVWNELITDDATSVIPFYQQVLGLTAKTIDMDGTSYTAFEVEDRMVGGTRKPPMAGIPNHWHVYFSVEDVPASAKQVAGLGGELVAGPYDTSIGPMAAVRDPQGAVFSIHAAPPATS